MTHPASVRRVTINSLADGPTPLRESVRTLIVSRETMTKGSAMEESAERWAADDPPDYLLKTPLFEVWRASEKAGLNYKHRRHERKLVVAGEYFTDEECESEPVRVARQLLALLEEFLSNEEQAATVIKSVQPKLSAEVLARENSWPEMRCRYRYGYDR